MYQLKTASERVTLATHLAMKGMSIADISEVLGHSEETVTRWLERSGMHSEKLHEREFKNLVVAHIQLDELVNKVRRWGSGCGCGRRKMRSARPGWPGMSGKRTQADAHRIVHRVKAVLAADCVPVFTSDGLQQYFYALTAHFGTWVEQEGRRKPVWQVLPTLLYGQFRKLKVGRKLKHVYTKMLCGHTRGLEAIAAGAGPQRKNPNGVHRAAEFDLTSSGGGAVTAQLGAGANRAGAALARGPGGRLLQLLPHASQLARPDGGGPLSWSDASHGAGGDRPLLERA